MTLTAEQSSNKATYEALPTESIISIVRNAMEEGCIRPCHVYDAVDELICRIEKLESSLKAEIANKQSKIYVSCDSPLRVKCHHCGKEIDHVMLDCFQRDGLDVDVPHEFFLCSRNDAGEPVVAILTSEDWTGDGLSGREQTEGCVSCPHCGEYPFKIEVDGNNGEVVPANVDPMTSIVFFPAEEDVVEVKPSIEK